MAIRHVRIGETFAIPPDLPPETQVRITFARANSRRILKVEFVGPDETVLEIGKPGNNNPDEGRTSPGVP